MGTDLDSPNNIPVDMNAGKTSPAKIEANRRNAQFSSGPKSPEGKKIVAANARKHGLLEKNIVISTGDGTEDQAEFDSLFFEMRAYYNPVGIAEDLLVQEIATSYWRSARALRCERGEITIGSTKYAVQPELGETEELLLDLQPESARQSLLGTSRGLSYLLQKIEETRKEVISSGAVSTESTKWLPRNSRQSWYGFSQQALVAALDKEIAELTTRKMQIEEDEFHERNARCDCSAIPPKEALDRIHRYETSNVRHRYKVEKRLQELQARRKENEKAASDTGTGDYHRPERFLQDESKPA